MKDSLYPVLQGQRVQHQVLTGPQHALFREGMSAVKKAESQMDRGCVKPQLGNDKVMIDRTTASIIQRGRVGCEKGGVSNGQGVCQNSAGK